MHTEIRKIESKSGHVLSSTFYFPDREMVGAVLILPAMGVSQKYYNAIASWLTTKGFVVATFDYSGTGQSQTGLLKDTSLDITDWAKFDCAAMIENISKNTEGKSLFLIGHSLGGQILGMIPNLNLVTKVISIASGSGYWLENVPSLKWRVWWLWYFVVPVAIRVYGYFPGKRLGKVGDLPGGVMSQWRKWCLNPEYLIGVEGAETRKNYSSVVTPISSISFTDDELMSKKNIDSLNSFYSGSTIKRNRITPDEVGAERIGHFGFFKPRFEASLWGTYLLPELK